MSRSRLFAVIAAVVLSVALVGPALAATLVTESTYTLAEDELVDGNLYVFASEIQIDGRVTGDVVGSASLLRVGTTGVVEGDVLGAAQGVEIRGQVDGDVRAAAFTVEVDGDVGGDLAAAGFSISLGEDASVGGDVLAAGSQGLVDGTVSGNVRFAGSALEINGAVEGDVEAHVDAAGTGDTGPMLNFMPVPMQPPRMASGGLEIGEGASIGGDLTYSSPEEQSIPSDAVGGSVDFDAVSSADDEADGEEVSSERSQGVEWLIDLVQEYIALLIVGALLLALGPRLMGSITAFLAARPLPSFGWGCLSVVAAGVFALVVPLLAVLAAVALGLVHLNPLVPPVLASGCLVGTLLTVGFYLLTWVAQIVVALWLGRAVTRSASENVRFGRWIPLLVGAAIVALLVTLPYVGGVAEALITLAGLGAIAIWLWRAWFGLRDVAGDIVTGAAPTEF